MDPVTLSLAKKYTDNALADSMVAKIYGVSWDKGELPALTRIKDSVGMTAAAGTDSAVEDNDFDNAQIYREIGQVTDTLGNVFLRIPKFYIRKTDLTNYKSIEVSKYQYPGFYLPWCFWDFTNDKELSYFDFGKYKGSKASTKLQSVPNVYPYTNDNIVNFRTAAEANNAGGLLGYQQLDIHAVDVLRSLMFVEFATLDIQSIMAGFTVGRYVATDVAVADTTGTNTIIVANATGAHYRVGQGIGVGSAIGNNSIFYGRTITQIQSDTPEAGQTTITFDGAVATIPTNSILYNVGWKNGFSAGIASSSGSLTSNSTGLYPCQWRGIESPYGDVWQFVDGININERQTWVCKNADDYISNVFASPYEQLVYVNGATDGYAKAMGWDSNLPFAEFPVDVDPSLKYYKDYYYQGAGEKIARVGGGWNSGSFAGISYWALVESSANAHLVIGGRLVRKAL